MEFKCSINLSCANIWKSSHVYIWVHGLKFNFIFIYLFIYLITSNFILVKNSAQDKMNSIGSIYIELNCNYTLL